MGSGEDELGELEERDQRNGMHDQRAAGVTKRRARMVGSCRRPDSEYSVPSGIMMTYQVLFGTYIFCVTSVCIERNA
jgi:hypothetical protein